MEAVYNDPKQLDDLEYESVCNDTRKITGTECAFVCTHGSGVDRHTLAGEAVEKGAKYIVCEQDLGFGDKQIIIPDANNAFAYLAARLYNYPSREFQLIGITGTNGKTTTTYLLKSIFEANGDKVGLIGTNCIYIGDERFDTENTTPDSETLQKLFRKMADNGCNQVIMEVSSHALALERVGCTDFYIAGFTNLSQDHLDFHDTLENYFEAKKKLFDISLIGVTNIDDEHGKIIEQEFEATGVSVNNFDNISLKPNETTFEYEGIPFSCKAVGRFNLQNISLAIGLAKAAKIELEILKEGLANFYPVSGRMEILDTRTPYTVIIDYAHTPDGLEKVLETCREFTKGRLISLFGCGGDRDSKKRPIMGETGCRLSDFAIITSDNPRTEEPNAIIDDILAGVSSDNYQVIPNRHEAIEFALKNANDDDVIVLCGKGHEDYQIIGTTKHHFDEHEIVKEILNN